MRTFLSSLLLALCAFFCIVDAQTCLDENGNKVDWFIVIKIAKREDSSFNNVATGVAYLYGDANSYATPAAFWSNSSHLISDPSSSVGMTVQQIYDGASNSDFGYVMYNDEEPSGTTSMSYGHTKGHMAWSASGGFWLIHSVPKFADSPDNVQSYVYPHTGEMYGQSMLCLTLDVEQIDQAFLQFQYTNPQVYGSQWVTALTSEMPNGNAFLNSNTVVMDSATSIVNITTVGGMSFKHFAKTVAWGSSIFGNLIGPYYGSDMIVETWQRPYEQPLLPPTTQVSVYSILELQAPSYANWDGVTWKDSEEHAKWGLMADSSLPILCIGDINKQITQWKRSGGMACITDQILSAAFAAFVTGTDQNGTNAAKMVKDAHVEMQ